MGSEKSLWRTIQKNMIDRWEADRVENPANPGTPDVYFTLKQTGTMGWIELKYAHEWPKRETTPLKLKHFTKQQRSFFRRHGELGANLFILLQFDREYFLLDYPACLAIGTLTRKDYIIKSIGYWKSYIDYEQFERLLIGY
jgi:hypothetical protein